MEYKISGKESPTYFSQSPGLSEGREEMTHGNVPTCICKGYSPSFKIT